MGVKIAIGSVVYGLVALGVSWRLWDCLSGGEFSTSAVIRNLVLSWGAPLATVLAVWRSMVAQDQAKTAQRGLLSDRHQRAVEMIGHDLVSVRLGGMKALLDLVMEYPKEYKGEVLEFLSMYKSPSTDEMEKKVEEGKRLVILNILANSEDSVTWWKKWKKKWETDA